MLKVLEFFKVLLKPVKIFKDEPDILSVIYVVSFVLFSIVFFVSYIKFELPNSIQLRTISLPIVYILVFNYYMNTKD